jgi:hypothetical protein
MGLKKILNSNKINNYKKNASNGLKSEERFQALVRMKQQHSQKQEFFVIMV